MFLLFAERRISTHRYRFVARWARWKMTRRSDGVYSGTVFYNADGNDSRNMTRTPRMDLANTAYIYSGFPIAHNNW